jgi:hypothetical protein
MARCSDGIKSNSVRERAYLVAAGFGIPRRGATLGWHATCVQTSLNEALDVAAGSDPQR